MRAVERPPSARQDGERLQTRSSPSRPVAQSVGNQMSGGRTGIGAVQDDAAQATGEIRGEHLANEGPVAVAVEVDLGDPERVHDRDDVRYGEVRAVERCLASELVGTLLEQVGIAWIARLDAGAIDRAGRAGAALVDDQDVAAIAQLLENVEVRIARAGRGVTRAAFLRQDRAERGAALVFTGVVLEADGDLAAHATRSDRARA